MLHSKKSHHPDYVFLAALWLLTIFGFLILASASSDLGKIKFNDTYFYLKHQFLYGLLPGLVGFFLMSKIYYQHWKKIAVFLLLFNIVLLTLVFTPLGGSHKGAARWLQISSFSFQPAELLKLSFIIYIAALLSNRKMKAWVFFAVTILVGALVIAQPATTIFIIIMAAALAIYFLSGEKLLYIFGIIILALAILSGVIYFSPYRYERVKSYFNKSSERELTSRYQLNQSLIAIGSGRLLGIGFGKSTIKYRSLPEAIGDSIFAVIAEEFGFIGAASLIMVFLIFFFRGLLIAKKCRDQFGKLLAAGLTIIIASQTFIHVAANTGLLPLTGVPLPFISYGGTALAVFLTMAGIIDNISKYT